MTPVTLKRNGRIWKADFTVLRESLKNPDLYFVFEMTPYVMDKNGKRIPIPSAFMFEIKLQEFLKP